MKSKAKDTLIALNKKTRIHGLSRVILFVLFVLLIVPSLAWAAGVHALFDLETPTSGPYPSDWFTVPDPSHNTGRRVSLPQPDCQVRRSDCEDVDVINTLDGFNLQPRLSIPFDGPIDVETVTSETVFLISLGSTLRDGDRDGRAIGINQVVWDTFTNTLHVKSDALLDQHTRYALIVTRGVLDESGTPVEASEAFRRFRNTVRGEYRRALLEAIHAARRLGVRERDIVTASVFTTQSATAILEKIRDQIKAVTPDPADFKLGPDGTRTVFPLNEVTGITFNQQTGDDPPVFTPVEVNVDALRIISGAVGRIAFGKYLSPDYEIHPGEYMPSVGTRTGVPAVQRVNDLYFNLFLPSGPRPGAGWPVAIYGHGNSDSKNGSLLLVAAEMAAHGVATIGINVVGHGFGSLGTLTVHQTRDDPVTFPAGGRGIDQDGDHLIGPSEGLEAAPPRTIVSARDGRRQTVVDFMQLVRVIERGMDVDGDGSPDLDASRIYYFGLSLGGFNGTIFLAVEPRIGVGVLNVAGGPGIDNRRLTANRPGVGRSLAARIPSLINPPGLTEIGGLTIGSPYFNENMPLRDGIPLRVRLADGTSHVIQSPVINIVAGAMEIQRLFDNLEWVQQSGDAVAYGPYLRRDPLPGVPAKSVIFQFARGDQTVPNPNTTAILRAGGLADRATLYRHDLAFAEDPTLPRNPHGFMVSIENPAFREIALGAQEEIARFFASDGKEIIHPEPQRFFEAPIVGPLPEDLGFIP